MTDDNKQCPHARIDHNGECLDCDEPVWVEGEDPRYAAIRDMAEALRNIDSCGNSWDHASKTAHAVLTKHADQIKRAEGE